ncbi:MAG: iron-containing alcohol dehydrogenase [Planctomycetota bacterium]|nr:MAG: iron-containing alcohol dehydrogenase [Planctomycetota bacterium]
MNERSPDQRPAVPPWDLSGRQLLVPFDCHQRTRFVYGPGTLARVGELAAEFGERVFLVTDPGLRSAGHEQRCIDYLKAAGLQVVVYDQVRSNPSEDDVQNALQAARDGDVQVIVGLGGGSSLDCAKGVNFLLTNGGRMRDYWGVGKARRPMLPMIAIPTTAGTGSEAQSFALITHSETHMKMACGDPKAACRVAILDPELTLTMPPFVTAVTGMDAISHAVETFVTRRRNRVSLMFSREAWRLLSFGFPRVLRAPDDLAARAAMLVGACLAGAAIENSMLGIAHSLANPLSANFGTVHGVAVGCLLPHVVRFNAEEVADAYAELAEAAGIVDRSRAVPARAAAEALAAQIQQWADAAGLMAHFPAERMTDQLLLTLAEQAAQQWTAQFNPRAAGVLELRALYAAARQSAATSQ